MIRSRGRPTIPIPVHPERVLSRAIKAGLSATIELQRNIKNKTTQVYYERSREKFRIRQQVYQLTKERGTPDFSHISKAEPPIRDDVKRMLYEKAAEYGFTETQRQKNRSDTVHPVNQRFNACGTVVRENSEIMFPHPEPKDFGTSSRRVGNTRKQFRLAGYEKSSFGPRVILAHPDLPSLDFGDAIRSHNEYLATFCAIHDVSVRETTRYSQLFFLLVRPYLEYLYSEFSCGKSNFQKGVNWALRQVKELIYEDGYQPTIYEKKTVTQQLEFEERNKQKRTCENWIFFKRMEEEARSLYGETSPTTLNMKRLRGELGEGEVIPWTEVNSIFTVDDVEHIRNKVARKARIAGSTIHKRIADLFPSPWYLNDIILSGDRYTRTSNYLILSEVPVETEHGSGKIDLLLCERTVSKDGKSVFWKPVFIIEIKTRLGQSLYVDANYKESEVRSKDNQRVVSDFPLSDHPLSEDHWEKIVQSTPTKSARNQLNIYSQALREYYATATGDELDQILRGVVAIESSSDIKEIRALIERFIIHGYENVKDRVRIIKRTVFTPSQDIDSRIALVIEEQPGPKKSVGDSIDAPWSPLYSPFTINKNTEQKFLLYLTGHSPTSAGQSAAWNARYYHGLQFLYEMKKKQKTSEFVWVDLASQFNEPRLAEVRLRLRPRGYSNEETAKAQPDHIREFFESIGVTGYLDEIMSYLYHDGSLPSFNIETRKRKQIIIISGADSIRDATPSPYRAKFSVLIERLISSFPVDSKTTVVWFDSPVPSVEKSAPYSTRALLPYSDTSPLGTVVTEIIWNLPVAPKGAIQPDKWSLPTIADTPMHDDIRVIVRQSPDGFHTELIHVPFLLGWSKRFRNKGSGQVVHEYDIDDIVPEKKIRNRMRLLSLTLLPWIVRLWPQETLTSDTDEIIDDQIRHVNEQYRGGSDSLPIAKKILPSTPCTPPRLLDLVTFKLPATMSGLSYQELSMSKINTQRLYRSPRKLQTKPLQKVSEDIDVPQVEALPTEVEEDRDWVFGVTFQNEEQDLQSWWLVAQDPAHPARMLVGCFTDRSPDKDGFLWAETRHRLVTQASLDEILGFHQTTMIGRTAGDTMEYWSSIDDDAPVYSGTLEFKSYGRLSKRHLRALRSSLSEEPLDRPSYDVRPSEDFYKRAVDALKRHLVAVSSPTPVSVHLDMDKKEGVCTVLFRNKDEVMQEVAVIYTADLISILRRPMTNVGPLFTDSGEYVTWSIFDDIDYGELDVISSYVTFTAARKAPAEIPKRLSQFFDEAESLSVSISHDTSICPIVLDEDSNHGACWRIELPPDCPARVRKQLGRAMTGEEVNGLLAPGKFYAGKLYALDFTQPTVSERNESIAFHEERYIRMFLRSKGLHLKKLPQGTFLLIADQKWVVSVAWEDSYFKWNAQSTVTSLFFKGGEQYIELIYTNDIQKESKRLLNTITSQIPPAQIYEYSELEEQVFSGLENREYSKISPPCELRFIEQTETICQYGVFLCDSSHSKALFTSTIDATENADPVAVIEVISEGLNEGEMSTYNIINQEEFMEHLSSWVNEYVPKVEWTGEEGGSEKEEIEWKVTLFVPLRKREVNWEAFQNDGDELLVGVLNVDKRVLVDSEVEDAKVKVREAIENEVVPELGHVLNLEEVLEEQVPKVLQKIRSQEE